MLPASAPDCTPLVKIDVDEQELFPVAAQKQMLGPLIGSCIDAELIERLLALISDYYIARGFVTTRPYLLEQDILDGEVEVRVLRGGIEAIIDVQSGIENSRISSAFAFHDEVLNLRDLETALETMQRVPSISASFEIKPGNSQGGSIIAIKTIETGRLHVEIGANAQTDSDPALSLQTSVDNPFNINDILEFRHNTGSLREAYQSNRGNELSYSFALGSYLFELIASDVSLRQRVQGINDSYLSRGDSRSSRVKFSKLLARNRENKYSMAFSLLHKDTQNYFDDILIDVSSYQTAQAQLDLIHTWLQPWGQIATAVSYHQGLEAFGARDDAYHTLENGFENPASLQFKKIGIDSLLQVYFADSSYHGRLNLHLQYSDDMLFDNDKLSLGSNYSVRGYDAALSGGNAGYLRGEIIKALQFNETSGGGMFAIKAMSISIGLDYGEVKCEVDNSAVCGDIYGVGLGLEVADANFYGSLSWAHPLKQIGEDIGSKDRFSLDLRWKF